VEVTEEGQRLARSLDGAVCVALDSGETRAADLQHRQVERLRARAEQPLGEPELLAGLVDVRLRRLDAG
jgi:hypothetical protein